MTVSRTSHRACPPLGFLLTHAFSYVTAEQLDDEIPQELPRLKRACLIRSFRLSVRLPELTQLPLLATSPGDHGPALGPVAWALKKRWRDAKPRHLTIYSATPKAARLFGGLAHKGHPQQIEHDLLVATVYFRRWMTDPQDALLWRSEILIRKYAPGIPYVPDAFLLDPQSATPARAIEIGGQYTKAKLRSIKSRSDKLGLPLEIW